MHFFINALTPPYPLIYHYSDPVTGKTYYVNTTTNETQWNFPAALPAGNLTRAHNII